MNLQCTRDSISSCQEGWNNGECISCTGLTQVQCKSTGLACHWIYDMCFPISQYTYDQCIQNSIYRAWSTSGCINCWQQPFCTGPCTLSGSECIGRRLPDPYYQRNLIRCQSLDTYFYSLNGFNSQCFLCEDCSFNTYHQCIEKGYYYGFDQHSSNCVDCSQFDSKITCSPLICHWDINCHGLRLGDPGISLQQCFQYGEGQWKYSDGVCSQCDPDSCTSLCHFVNDKCMGIFPDQVHTYH